MRLSQGSLIVVGVLLFVSVPSWAGSSKSVYVHGYTTRSGKHVSGYTRSAPEHHKSPSTSSSSKSSGHSPSITGRSGSTGLTAHRATGVDRDSHGRIKRSSSARMAFLRSQHLDHTPKGCQVDHVVPLSKGGADDPSNMQLLCGEALRAKERTERR